MRSALTGRGRGVWAGSALLAVGGIISLVLAGGPGAAPSAPSSANGAVGSEQTVDAGDVEVTATLASLGPAGAVVELAFDTHTVDIDVDLAAAGALTVAGTSWPVSEWEGDPPGGHHRAGQLAFDAAGPVDGSVKLAIGGLPAAVEFSWTVQSEAR